GFDEAAYESAAELPTYYRAMNLPPRQEHPFHLYDAIRRQPELVAQALKTIVPVAKPMAREIAARHPQRILLTGIGASYDLAATAAHIFSKLTGLPAHWTDSAEAIAAGVSSDYPDTVVIGLSASGNTLETVDHLRLAREAGAYTLAFVNLDNTRLTAAAHDRYVAPGGYGLVWDYSTRLAALTVLAIELAQELGRPAEPLSQLQAMLNEVPAQMQQVLDDVDERCRSLGALTTSLRAAVVVSSGALLPTTWEMSLRFEEMAHFPARGRSVVEFLHGGVGYLAPDILTVLLVPHADAHAAMLRVAKVTQTLKTPFSAIVDHDEREISRLADSVVRLPKTDPLISPLLYVLPAQLIPYYTEVARPGGNPDVQRTDQPIYARAFDVAYPPKSH
ncbi:MAG TPA: SIS domain-containing protein, partial [Anaerolineae bacterium]|nr:SIS domain-containing protein [Anaerolineae bacterium]